MCASPSACADGSSLHAHGCNPSNRVICAGLSGPSLGCQIHGPKATLEMDTNPVENQIRTIALKRKNALFAGNEVGAENWAMLASLCAILDGHPQSRIEDLMPWCFNQPSSLAA